MIHLRYILPLLRKKKILMGDMQPNLEEHDSKLVGDRLALFYQKSLNSKNPLFSAIEKVYGFRFMLLGLLCFFRDGILK